MRLLLTVVRSEGVTALVATHDEALIDLADEVLRLEDGHLVTDRVGAWRGRTDFPRSTFAGNGQFARRGARSA